MSAALSNIRSLSTKEFAPFRLDTVNECLWRHRDDGDEERIRLTPKAFAVLRYLVEHAGRLVTQNELLEAVWPDTFVQPEVLKSQILDVRHALGDDAKARGMAQIAREAGLGRESLYKALSSGAHPRYDTIKAVLGALRVKLSVVPNHAPR